MGENQNPNNAGQSPSTQVPQDVKTDKQETAVTRDNTPRADEPGKPTEKPDRGAAEYRPS